MGRVNITDSTTAKLGFLIGCTTEHTKIIDNTEYVNQTNGCAFRAKPTIQAILDAAHFVLISVPSVISVVHYPAKPPTARFLP